MPPAVAAGAAIVSALGTAGTIAVAISIASAGYAYYASQKSRDMKQGTGSSERKQTFRSANAPKQVIYGELEVSGPIIFVQEEGSPNDSGEGEKINLVIPLAGHPLSKCLGVRVGEIEFTKVSDTKEGNHWSYRKDGITWGDVWFYSRAATATGVPGSLRPINQWKDSMIGRGQSFLHARLRSGNKQWPGGIEDVVARVQGALVYDPRSKKSIFSTNPVLQGLHYIRTALQVPDRHIMMDTFIAAANICDETVTRAGVVEPRYACHGIFDEDTDPKQVLGNIAATMAGDFIRSGGLWAVRAGAYYGPPTRTLSREEAIGSLDIRVSQPLQERINTITGQYLDAKQNYNLTDFPSVSRPEYIKEDGRERKDDLSLDFVQSVTQAQALAWIELERRRRGAMVSGTFKLSAMDVVMGRVLAVDFPGVSGLVFRVVSWNLDPGNGIRLELAEDDPSLWTGQPADIVLPVLPGEIDQRDPRSVDAVTGLNFTRTPDELNQHGVLSWSGRAANYEVVLLDGDKVLWKYSTHANLIPITLPVADKVYTVAVVAVNAFGVKSAASQATLILTLAAPKVTTRLLNTHDHFLEVSWTHEDADSFELRLQTEAGDGVYRTVVKGSPVQLGWFSPGIYRLDVRAFLGITPSPWSDRQTVHINSLNPPTPHYKMETTDPTISGGMLSFSDKDPRTERVEFEVSGPGFTFSGDCPGTPVRLPTMLPAVYRFRARAQWRDVYSVWNTISQRFTEGLTTPTDLTFTASDNPGIQGDLRWKSNASLHQVTITGGDQQGAPVQTQVNGHQYQVPILKVGRYEAEVVGIGRWEESAAATLLIDIQAPDAPANLTFTDLDNDPASAGVVRWETVAGVSGYQVELSDPNEVLVTSIVTDNQWLIAPLTPGNYTVNVASISQREAALSEYSSVAFVLHGLATPTGLTVEENLKGSGIQIVSQVTVTCQCVPGATGYVFEYQLVTDGNWSGIQSGPALSAVVNAIAPGTYNFRVRATSTLRQSGFVEKTVTVKGTLRPPQPLANLRLHAQSGTRASLSWDVSSDPDVLTGGSIHVRHTHIIGKGATWDSSPQVTDRLPGNATLADVPLLSGTYLVKPVNANGFYAETAAVVLSNMAGNIGYNRVEEREEPTNWPGEKNQSEVTSGGSLTMKGGGNLLLSIDTDDEVRLHCGKPIPVDTRKTYRGALKIRQTEDDPTGQFVYAGVVTLDKDFNNITGGAGNHRYFIVARRRVSTSDGWLLFEGTIGGEGDTHDQFRPGTRYVRPVFIVNYNSKKGRAAVDYMKFYDESGTQLIPNPDFSQGKEGWSLAYVGETVPDNAKGEVIDNPDSPYYVMEKPLDLKAVVTARVTMEVDASVYLEDFIDDRKTPIDNWGLFDGTIYDDVSLRYELSQTDDDPTQDDAVWSPWIPFIKGEFRGRGYRLRVVMLGNVMGSAATLVRLRLLADVQDRIEKGSNILARDSGIRVDYKIPFLAPPSISITTHIMLEQGRWELVDQDRTGFSISFFQDDKAVEALFDYQAIGYGESE